MTDYNVGDPVIDPLSVPIGTTIANHGTNPFGSGRPARAYRTLDGWLDTRPGWMYSHGYGGQGSGWSIESLPAQPIRETPNQWLQRLHEIVWARQSLNGMDRAPIRRALERMNLPDYEPSLGQWVAFAKRPISDGIFVGALVEVGNPNDWDLYGLWQWNGHDWAYLTGGHNYAEGGHLIEASGLNYEDWVLNHDYDDDAVHNMKVKLWEVGMEMKSNTGWCGEVEHTMRRLGAHENLHLNQEAAA